jgi:tetratricopeptide (TPR) repeat protein
MTGAWDLFFSYRRHDLDRARPLLKALSDAGIRVWRDENDIPEQASITAEIRDGIANSRAFLAFYSSTYPLSNPCQQELTTAWLAAHQISGAANARVWIVNPESGFEHIPELLRDQQAPSVGEVNSQAAKTARGIKDRLDALDERLLGSGVRDIPAYYGISPVQARRFTGRSRELWDLHGKLTANRISITTGIQGQTATQVRGLGGNGKSLLAREYSIKFGPAYPGGVFWLSAYGHDDARGALTAAQREALRRDQIREFAFLSGLPTEGLKPEEIETALWRKLECRGDRCLWIIDDLPSGLSLDDFQKVWTARWPGASTLITTRSKVYGFGSALDLGVLSTEEAFALLCSHLQSGSSDEMKARRIVELLGCHPLAIDVAGSYLAQRIENFESYVKSLENPTEDAAEFGALLEESLPTGHERSISATLLNSIRQLGSEGLDFLRLGSLLASAPIQMSFVVEVFEALGEGGAAKIRALQAVGQAAALSLCESSGDTRTVHTLVSRTMRFQFPGNERILKLRSAAVEALTRRLGSNTHITDHLKITMDMPHARHLVASDLATEREARLAVWVGHRDYERGDYASARRTQEQALAMRLRFFGEEHLDTLEAMSSLAMTLSEQGDLVEARKMHERALAGCRRALGEDHPGTLRVMGNLAVTLCSQGDLTRARELDEQVLAARRRVLGEDHPESLAAKNNLASTLYQQGDLGGARKLQEHVLVARRRVLGEDHPDTVMAMSNLAVTLSLQGDLAGARECQKKVLAAYSHLLGPEHPDTLKALGNVASTLYEQGDLGEASQLQERALAAHRRLLGEEHPSTLMAMNNLATTLSGQGDLKEARKLQEQVLAAGCHVLGDEHPITLCAMANLAVMLHAQGNLVEARKLQERTVAAISRVLGEDHPDTLKALGNLVSTLYDIRDLATARKLAEQVLAASRRLLGGDHPHTLTAMFSFSQILHVQGDLAEARKLAEEVFAARRRVLGEEHSDTLVALRNIAVILCAEGDLAGARTIQDQVLTASRHHLGEGHPETLVAMNNLAATLYEQGNLAGARELQEQALAASCRVLGDEHPITLTTRSDLALTLSALGDLTRARELNEQVLGGRRRVLGDGHPDTITSMGNLAATLAEQGDLARARELNEQVLAARRGVLGDEHPDTLAAMRNVALILYAQANLAEARNLQELAVAGYRRVLGDRHPETQTARDILDLIKAAGFGQKLRRVFGRK